MMMQVVLVSVAYVLALASCHLSFSLVSWSSCVLMALNGSLLSQDFEQKWWS